MNTALTAHPVPSWSERLRRASWWRVVLIWIATELFRIGLTFLSWGSAPLFITAARAQSAESSIIRPGEVLRYKVKWTLFRLGTVEIRQIGADSLNPGRYLVSLSVRSAAGLPFIDLHLNSKTWENARDLNVLEEHIVNGSSDPLRTLYRFDPANHTVLMVDSSGGEQERLDTLANVASCYDAVGLFMVARILSASGIACTIPTLNDYIVSNTDLNFNGDEEEISVDAFDHPVRARHIRGFAHWAGNSFAGLNGEFEGWISDDEAAIPLRAKVGILLGSIVLELEDCERGTPRQDTIASSDHPVVPREGGLMP